jgi:hypothetical protein
VKAFVAK